MIDSQYIFFSMKLIYVYYRSFFPIFFHGVRYLSRFTQCFKYSDLDARCNEILESEGDRNYFLRNYPFPDCFLYPSGHTRSNEASNYFHDELFHVIELNRNGLRINRSLLVPQS